MESKYNKALTPLARELRKNMTPQGFAQLPLAPKGSLTAPRTETAAAASNHPITEDTLCSSKIKFTKP